MTSNIVFATDRDKHVRVNYLNVLPDKWIDYAWNPLQFPLGAPYDCDSIMHYTHTSFNIGRTRTLEAVDPARCRLRYRGYPAALPLPVKVPVPDPDQSGQGTDQDPVQLLAADTASASCVLLHLAALCTPVTTRPRQ